MKMYHEFKRPLEALEMYQSKVCFKKPYAKNITRIEVESAIKTLQIGRAVGEDGISVTLNVGRVFNGVISHKILMDLLYNTGHYQEVLDVMNYYLENRRNVDYFPNDLVHLSEKEKIEKEETKLTEMLIDNTSQSYEYGLKMILDPNLLSKPLKDIMLMSKFALRQNKPNDALQFFKLVRNPEFAENIEMGGIFQSACPRYRNVKCHASHIISRFINLNEIIVIRIQAGQADCWCVLI
ncbi:hypothetical protein GQR58_015809 [Nymphon striatum]|nr:hypothetical protein GQR58_015809 [Nymphon striatum]